MVNNVLIFSFTPEVEEKVPICHSRKLLSGIHTTKQAGFPLDARGNDIGGGFLHSLNMREEGRHGIKSIKRDSDEIKF